MSNVRERLRSIPGRLRGAQWGRITDNVIKLAVVATLAGVAVLTQQQSEADRRDREIDACLARFAEESARATVARSAIAAEDRAVAGEEQRAADAIFQAAASADRQALSSALRDYLATRARADETRAANEIERAANPVPDPSLSCQR